jgi:hypothetical protein
MNLTGAFREHNKAPENAPFTRHFYVLRAKERGGGGGGGGRRRRRRRRRMGKGGCNERLCKHF